jgi:SAM-dependent methyltransferase
MNPRIELITECRICKSKELVEFLEFKNLPFFDDIVPANRIGKEFVFPMKVYVCKACFVVQSLHNVDIADYYKNYQYNASDSDFTKKYMEILARKTWNQFALEVGDSVIDIGSADGYQLKCFEELGAKVLGFEPASNLAALALEKGVYVLEELFDENSIKALPDDFQKVACVTLLHTFDHLQRPFEILTDIATVLKTDTGVLVIEVHDLEQMIENQETALFGHEHTIFLHAQTIKLLLDRAGFKVINYNFIAKEFRRGTSMVVVAALKSSVFEEATIPNNSRDFEFNNVDIYLNFKYHVDNAFSLLRNYVKKRRLEGLKIAGYGGWGRGVTFLSMAGFQKEDFQFICDQNVDLHGNFTPGTSIPITSPERLLEDSVDEVIIFNHAYYSEIETQQEKFIKNGGKITSVLSILNGDLA